MFAGCKADGLDGNIHKFLVLKLFCNLLFNKCPSLLRGVKYDKLVRLLTLQGISFHNKFNQIADKIKVLNIEIHRLHFSHQSLDQRQRDELSKPFCGRPKTILARGVVF